PTPHSTARAPLRPSRKRQRGSSVTPSLTLRARTERIQWTGPFQARTPMPPAQEWSSNFFDGLVVESLRRLTNDAQTQAEADYLLRMLQPTGGSHILDVPCGNGRLSVALARRGYRLPAPALSPAPLDAARRAAVGLPATFEQCDMRDLPWSAAFDHAFCFGNSFAYFDDAGNLAFLQAVNAALKPGGRFV